MPKKNSKNTNLKASGTVFVCGYCYDDFSEGGFDIFAICTSMDKAKIKRKEHYDLILQNWKDSGRVLKKPNMDDFEIRTMPLF